MVFPCGHVWLLIRKRFIYCVCIFSFTLLWRFFCRYSSVIRLSMRPHGLRSSSTPVGGQVVQRSDISHARVTAVPVSEFERRAWGRYRCV